MMSLVRPSLAEKACAIRSGTNREIRRNDLEVQGCACGAIKDVWRFEAKVGTKSWHGLLLNLDLRANSEPVTRDIQNV